MIYIMKGCPGSGKTHYINNTLKPDGMTVICSADHYFMDNQGNYNFDPKQLPKAHGECLKRYVYALQTDCDIVVDNTNLKNWELSPYVSLANAFERDYKIVEIICEPSKAAQRNQHGVPLEKVHQMYKSNETCPPWWNCEQVYV